MRDHADIYVVGISNGGDDQDRLLSRRLAGTLERGGFSCTGDHEGDENELSRVNIAATLCRCVFFVLAPGAQVDAAVVARCVKRRRRENLHDASTKQETARVRMSLSGALPCQCHF